MSAVSKPPRAPAIVKRHAGCRFWLPGRPCAPLVHPPVRAWQLAWALAWVNDGSMARYPPQTRYAQSSGAKIAYQVSGTGPPNLVMVHGLVSHLDIQWQQTGYRRFVRALERGGRLIRLDKRGTGLSDPAAELPTTQERVQDVTAVMAAAKSSRAVLFGLSDGGRAAIAFAAAYPGRTRGLDPVRHLVPGSAGRAAAAVPVDGAPLGTGADHRPGGAQPGGSAGAPGGRGVRAGGGQPGHGGGPDRVPRADGRARPDERPGGADAGAAPAAKTSSRSRTPAWWPPRFPGRP